MDPSQRKAISKLAYALIGVVIGLGGFAAQAWSFGNSFPATINRRSETGLVVARVIYLPISLKKHAGRFSQQKTPTLAPLSTSSHTPTSEILTPTPSPTPSGINIPAPGVEVYSSCSVREERHDTNSDEVTGAFRTIYNSLGRPIKIEQDIVGSSADGKIDYITTYIYKNLWQPVERLQYQVGGGAVAVLGKTTFEYNSSDQLVREIADGPNGQIIKKLYQYNLDGMVIRVTGGGDTETREYNNGELYRKSIDYASDGKIDRITLIEWSGGLITKTIDDIDSDGQGDVEWVNTYDALNRLVISESPVGISYYLYNERGWMYSYRIEQGAGDRIRVTYKYDDEGRLVRLEIEDTDSGPSFREYQNDCP